jgi:Uma2 family endonuclease
MTLASPPRPVDRPGHALAPLLLPDALLLTPEQFEAVCQANPNAVLELDANGHLIRMTPTGSETGSRNQALGALLWIAVRASGLPLKVFDSSSGFLITQLAPWQPTRGNRVVHRYQPGHGPQHDPVPERPLPA